MSAAHRLTRAAMFGEIPRIRNHVFEVRAGVPIEDAISTAACLAESIEALALGGSEDGITPEAAYLVQFAAQAIQALMGASEGATP